MQGILCCGCRPALSKQLSNSSLQQTSLACTEAWQLIWLSSAASTERPVWNPQDNIELGEFQGLVGEFRLGNHT